MVHVLYLMSTKHTHEILCNIKPNQQYQIHTIKPLSTSNNYVAVGMLYDTKYIYNKVVAVHL